MTDEAVEREALEDLLRGSEVPLGRGPNGPGAREGSGLSRGNGAEQRGIPAEGSQGIGPRVSEEEGRADERQRAIDDQRRGPEPAS